MTLDNSNIQTSHILFDEIFLLFYLYSLTIILNFKTDKIPHFYYRNIKVLC